MSASLGSSSRAAVAMKEDEGELSDSTKTVRRLQQELLNQDSLPPGCHSKLEQEQERVEHKRSREDKLAGDGVRTGLLTGIRLGEFAPGAKRRREVVGGGAGPRGRPRFEQSMGMGLESLVNQMDSEDELTTMAPEAPRGSFKRHHVQEQAVLGADAGATTRPKAKLGIDGKVWDFIEEPEAPAADPTTKLKRKSKVIPSESGDSPRRKKMSKKKKEKKKKKTQEKRLKQEKSTSNGRRKKSSHGIRSESSSSRS